jgi:hypothetical protein
MIQSQENQYAAFASPEADKKPTPPNKSAAKRLVLAVAGALGLGILAKHNQEDAALREANATPIVTTQGPEIQASPIPPAVTLDATGNSHDSRVDFNSPNATSTEVPPTTE